MVDYGAATGLGKSAAGIPPINTVGHPGPVIGPPTCGIGGVPGVTIGHTCMSPILAAGFPIFNAGWLSYSILM